MPDSADLGRADDSDVRRDGGSRAGMPRWVKVSLIIGLALVLLFVIGKITGIGGEHGPGRHGGGDTPSSVVDDEGGHVPPVDHGS